MNIAILQNLKRSHRRTIVGQLLFPIVLAKAILTTYVVSVKRASVFIVSCPVSVAVEVRVFMLRRRPDVEKEIQVCCQVQVGHTGIAWGDATAGRYSHLVSL